LTARAAGVSDGPVEEQRLGQREEEEAQGLQPEQEALPLRLPVAQQQKQPERIPQGQPYNIRVLAVSPGAVDTEMLRQAAP
jgi:hypothetical protein